MSATRRAALIAPEFVARAVATIDAVVDDDRDAWRNPLWAFVRAMRGHPALEGLDADAALGLVEASLRLVYPGVTDPWAELVEDITGDEAVEAFLDAWPRVRIPLGAQLLEGAVDLASSQPLMGPGDTQNRRPAAFLALANVVLWLSWRRGGRCFLSARTAAEAVGVPRMSADRALRLMITDGWLRVARTGERRPGGRATEYELVVDKLPPAVCSRMREMVHATARV